MPGPSEWLIILVLFVIPWVWALSDALRVSDDSAYRAGTKVFWVLVIVFLGLLGAIWYFAVGRPRRPA
jgi:hypothetical protein